VLFEAATGDLLFNPKSGKSWGKDEDHLALCIELLGKMPRKIALEGKYAKDFFNRNGELRRIHDLKFWDLESVLSTKYQFSDADAAAFAAFLKPMLNFNPARRATAASLLSHPWLRASVPPTTDGCDRTAGRTSEASAAAMGAVEAASDCGAKAGPEEAE